jgi:hypothetical protein
MARPVGPNFGFANKAALEAVHASPHVGYFFGRFAFIARDGLAQVELG